MPAESRGGAAWRFAVGFLSDVGLHRERNEDAFHVFLPYAGEAPDLPVDAVFAVADGMGGHEDGDVAGRFVADAVERELAVSDAPDPGDLRQWLRGFTERLNRALYDVGVERSNRGMGSTLTMVVLRGGHLYLGHVGDSRCYRLTGARLEQMTQDHSWVAEQVRAGLLSADEAEQHPDRNLLTQCLGVGKDLETYVADEPLREGGRYLLCSDGLHGLVSDGAIERVLLKESDPQAAATKLVGLALEAGGHDNVTVLVFDASTNDALSETLPGSAASADEVTVAASLASEASSRSVGRPIGGRRTGVRRRVARGSAGAMLVGAGLLISAGIGGWKRLRSDPAAVPHATEVRSTAVSDEDSDGMVDTDRLDAGARLPAEAAPSPDDSVPSPSAPHVVPR
ncbi:MAG: protein phosphatase 2C domain-containing protein [Gemmatimonadetes bacterium]|nr:protein phosphatase 2C domain-containing protein [Gemmatimonadota bacterium]